MNVGPTLLPILMLVTSSGPPNAPEPLACNANALSTQERDQHDALAEKLKKTVVGMKEIANGYELALDLSRIPADLSGQAFCVVEVAEWVDMEARCCPFLEFGIDVSGKGGPVTLRLTGGQGVKAFLRTELPLLAR